MNLIDVSDEAATKLEEKHRNVFALTLKEIRYILFSVYNVDMSASKLRKTDYMACLMAEMEKYINKYERFFPITSQDEENRNTAKIPV